MIMYRPGFQQGRSDALSRRSYLASKEGDAVYDQRHSVLLKPKQLLLKILHIMISMDPTFLKDIRVSLLSDPLALKLKKLYTNFRSQNGQIKVSSFQTPNLEIQNPESPDSQNSNSWIHRLYEGKRPQDDIDLRFQFMDGLLSYQGLLYIPDGPCRLQVL
jgi:hypothetical protein